METMEMFGAVLVSTFQFSSLHVSLRKLGHCYLMMDDLQQAYSAYQQALYHLRDPKASYFNQPLFTFCDSLQTDSGTETLVRHWNSL
jgi:hypothetical protein